ncbi:MAG: (2Fe-2S) ferredoxin domain-containing protein [Deltaproteobacteria bacterium]|jgi:NADP-reducing hydrogenase subunit HndB|nr:MAG: (2Fe-2S) ferredoxin domain-containing protein [Deltaproteobacteria bacterium]
MSKLKVEDLDKIKKRVNKESVLREDGYTARITVHMGTCGIAAGAEGVRQALNEEIEMSNRKDIQVIISGCMGMCSSEPNVTVRCIGQEAILYGDLDAEKMRQIFQGHLMNGEIQGDFAVARIK